MGLSSCANGREQAGDTEKGTQPAAELPSAHSRLSDDDLEHFEPGREQKDILKDIQWRGSFERATAYKGKVICAILFEVFGFDSYHPTQDGSGALVWAIFIDGKFDKFVRLDDLKREEDIQIVDVNGTPWSRPKPIELGDFPGLIIAIETDPVDMAELKKEVMARPEPPSQTDPGLTLTWLLLRGAIDVADEADYIKNAELRDRYNAARLAVGMTEEKVESIIGEKPIESGKVETMTFKIYGSRESFNIDVRLHYSNILVLFQEGKVSGIYSGSKVPGGDRGLRELRGKFVGLK